MNLNGRLSKVEKQTRLTTVPTWQDIADIVFAASLPPNAEEAAAIERINILTEDASLQDFATYQDWLEANEGRYIPVLDTQLPRWREYFLTDEFAAVAARHGFKWREYQHP